MGGLDDSHNGGLCGLAGFACNKKGGIKFVVCLIYELAGDGWTFLGGKKKPPPKEE